MRFYAVIQNGISLEPVVSGRLADAVLTADTTVDFGQVMVPGDYVMLRGLATGGSPAIEHMLIGSLVSGTTYNVTRDVSDENGTNPGWPIGTKWVASADQDIAPPPHVLDSVDVTGTIRFGTQLNGGFSGCTFSLSSTSEMIAIKLSQYPGAHVEIWDSLGRIVWEGYVTGVSQSGSANTVQVTCSGYYGKASDLFFDMIYSPDELTTNLVPNPSFENNVTDGGWAVYATGSGGTFTRSTTYAKYGSASARLLQPNSSPDLSVQLILGVTGGYTYVFSLWMKKDASLSGGTPYIQITDQSGNSFFSQQVSYLNTDWQRITLPSISAGAGVTQLRIYINVPNKTSTQGSVYIDGVQLEQRGYTTPYCDGSLDGCSWAGTAHNSVSTRAASAITADQILVDCVNFMYPYWSPITSMTRNDLYDIGPCDFSGKKVKDAIEYVMSYGTSLDDEAYATFFALWSGRMAEVILEPRADYLWPDWYLSIDQVHSRKLSSISIADMYNRVYSTYADGDGGPIPTIPSEDEYSIARYGLREGFLQTGDVPFTATRSYFLQDAALERYRYPRPVYTIEIDGMIQSSAGFLDYPYRIRAGDTIILHDGDMTATTLGSVAGQVANRLVSFVLKTEYDPASGILRLDIGSADQSFEALMGRLGISGGLQ